MLTDAQREGNAKGGRSKSPAKTAASRLNGAKGGRPTKISKMTSADVIHAAMLAVQRAEAKKVAAEQRAAARLARIARLARHVLPQPKIPKPRPMSMSERLLARHLGTLKDGVPCPCPSCVRTAEARAAALRHLGCDDSAAARIKI